MSFVRQLLRKQATLDRCFVGSCRRLTSTPLSSILAPDDDAVTISTPNPTPQPRASNPLEYRPMSENFHPTESSKKPTESFKKRQKRKTFRSRFAESTAPTPPRTIEQTAPQPGSALQNSPPRREVQRKEEEFAKESQSVVIPTSSWIYLSDCPPLATLDDVVNSVEQVLNIELKIGILDVDAMDGTMIEPTTPWVKSAKVVLSAHGRPLNWRIEFENRSVVHAFLEHTKETKFMCVWKPAAVSEWIPGDMKDPATHFNVNDSMIRVENCPEKMTIDHVRHLFRRYDLTTQGNSITSWVMQNNRDCNMFIVQFADASFARAAVREMQGIEVANKTLKLGTYPKQL